MTQVNKTVDESRRVAWRVIIRAGCVAMNSQPSWMIENFSTSMRFPGATEEERYQLEQLAHRLAEEYGLRAETHDTGVFIRVKLLRPGRGAKARSGDIESASGVVPTAASVPSQAASSAQQVSTRS